MVRHMCTEHGDDFWGLDKAIEHLRRHHASFIRRPGRLGAADSHGHIWYCMDCESRYLNDHRSFDSDGAMWKHLTACHPFISDCVEVISPYV
ncbi:hypothetical protein BJX76DRAFT_343143 [Aspergillus varians]